MGEYAEDLMEGYCCSECGVYFEQPHGHPVICKECYKEYEEDGEECEIPVAIHDEL